MSIRQHRLIRNTVSPRSTSTPQGMRAAVGIRLSWWRDGWNFNRCHPKSLVFRSRGAALRKLERLQGWTGGSRLSWVRLEMRREFLGEWVEVELPRKRGGR